MVDVNLKLAISFVGTIAILALGGVIYLTAIDHSIPDVLVATTSGSLTGLIGLMVNPADKDRDGE